MKINLLFLIRICLVFILIDDQLWSQSIVKDYEFPAPSLGEGNTKSVKIYFPSGYNAESKSEKYNLIIYLHGASGNDHKFMSSILKPSADELIEKRIIMPCIIIMPNLQSYRLANYGNRHMYENSNYYGMYADVILGDLINYLKSTNDQNLKDKLVFKRENMSIAGFSMGGDGALRLGLKHPDIFIAIATHGAAPSFSQSIAGSLVTSIVNENRNSKDANGNYKYDPNNGVNTEAILGISAAWNPNSTQNEVQFLLNTNGTLNMVAYKAMIPNADCQSIIQSKGLYKTATNNPFIYLEVGTADGFFGVNNQFVAELGSLAVDPKWYTYVTSAGKPHGFDVDRAKDAIKWISSKMSAPLAAPIRELKLNQDYSVLTDYTAHRINIKTHFNDPSYTFITLTSITGQKIFAEKLPYNHEGEINIDMKEHATGIYTLTLESQHKYGTRKIFWR